jgi:hypothetical protein
LISNIWPQIDNGFSRVLKASAASAIRIKPAAFFLFKEVRSISAVSARSLIRVLRVAFGVYYDGRK